jgi:hypothetical protein
LLLDSTTSVETIVDPKDAAETAGLRYVTDARPGIRRRKSGKGFAFACADGSKLTELDVLKRIKLHASHARIASVGLSWRRSNQENCHSWNGGAYH